MNWRLAPLLVALLVPWEAQTSGSSTVRAVGPHLAVTLSSPRKIFRGGEGEREWHADWRASHQPEVDAALARLEPVLTAFAVAEALTLTAWAESLPEAWPWAPPEAEESVAKACAPACRALLRPHEAAGVTGVPWVEVEVALGAPPPEGALDRLNEALARALVELEPRP